jgi:hypothetical protein
MRPEHYKGKGIIEPIDLIEAQNLGFAEGNIVKYVTRWQRKNGVEDLKKAKWYLDRLIEKEENEKDGN